MTDTVLAPSISSDAAHRMITAAEAKAVEIGMPMCIAIVDVGGNLKAFSRMDGAPLAAGAPTGIPRLVIFGGGYPIVVDGSRVGGIGVSGGHWGQDMQVAEAGLGALA